MRLRRSSKENYKNITNDGLAVWSVNKTRKGKLRSVREYVDMNTGEIIPADGAGISCIDLRDRHAQREAALASLRPEVREFAEFVLAYRNKRRGITPGVNTLCHWYAALTGQRSDNVRRYVSRLEAAGILAGENVCGPLFQITGATRTDCMGEDIHAADVFITQHMTGKRGPLRRRMLDDGSITPDPRPIVTGYVPAWSWQAIVTAALARIREHNAEVRKSRALSCAA